MVERQPGEAGHSAKPAVSSMIAAMTRKTLSFEIALLGAVVTVLFAVFADAQVRSVTLGLRTHCPYGIRGCWPEIRDGLEAPPEIAAIVGEPDVATDTCVIKMRDGWTAEPGWFQRNFTSMR